MSCFLFFNKKSIKTEKIMQILKIINFYFKSLDYKDWRNELGK